MAAASGLSELETCNEEIQTFALPCPLIMMRL
jgi:hypothetical protein